jgi:methionine sulfoxide reductase heme-binding subunit
MSHAIKQQRVFALRISAHILSMVPLAWMIWDVLSNSLSGDPVRILTHRTGWWALFFLLASLAMTPLRRVTGSADWIRIRRMLGLWGFAFASMHLLIYIVLDLQGAWANIFADIVKRPYITVGFTAWLLLIPLAITSTQGMMRRLGRKWGKLHRLAYVIAPLGVLHFLWLVKKDLTEPLIFAAVLLLLFLMRWQRATQTSKVS